MSTPFVEVAAGLFFPEGPIAMPDGDVLIVEIGSGRLSRIQPDGRVLTVAQLGGGPNGAAVGPDGWIYVCNNGGNRWDRHPEFGMRPVGQADDYSGGRIERVHPEDGRAEVLYDRTEEGRLSGPNDIVFDRTGGFWFTDIGKGRPREMDRGGIYYAAPDGSRIRQAVYPVVQPNGIALSPDETRLYVAETVTGRLLEYELAGPGEVVVRPWPAPSGGRLLGNVPGYRMFDSMAVDADGNISVATLMEGAITTFSPDGAILSVVEMPDVYTSNICFGGRALDTAYVTLSATGRIVSLPWPRSGLPLNFRDARPLPA